jgi:hypothetical protein
MGDDPDPYAEVKAFVSWFNSIYSPYMTVDWEIVGPDQHVRYSWTIRHADTAYGKQLMKWVADQMMGGAVFIERFVALEDPIPGPTIH